MVAPGPAAAAVTAVAGRTATAAMDAAAPVAASGNAQLPLDPSAPPDLKAVAVLALPGTCYPVEVLHSTRPVRDVVASAAATCWQLHTTVGPGDILVFLPGAEEIERCCEALAEAAAEAGGGAAPLEVAPLHAGLPREAQLRALAPSARLGKDGLPQRKAVIASPLAEAAVTLAAVRFVVDGGLARTRAYDAVAGEDTYLITPVSRACAAQRAGRAGRTASGAVLRLYTAAAAAALPARTPPETVRCDAAPLFLQLLALGVANPAAADLPDPPPPAAAIRALETLYALGALDGRAALTPAVGTALASLQLRAAVPPALGRALLAAAATGCAGTALTAAALILTSGGGGGAGGGGGCGVFTGWRAGAPRARIVAADDAAAEFAVGEGDVLSAVNAFFAWEGAGRDSGWASRHMLHHGALARAAALRAALRAALADAIARACVATAAAVAGGAPAPASAPAGHAPAGTAPAASDPGAWTVDDAPFSSESAGDALRRALLAGFFLHTARRARDGQSYVTLRDGLTATLHPASLLARFGVEPDFVCYTDAVRTGGDRALQLRGVTAVSGTWLLDVAPHYFMRGDAAYDPGDYLSRDSLATAGGETGPAPPPLAYVSAAERKRRAEAAAAAASGAAAAAAARRAAAAADPTAVNPSTFGRVTTGPAGPGHGGKSTRAAGVARGLAETMSHLF